MKLNKANWILAIAGLALGAFVMEAAAAGHYEKEIGAFVKSDATNPPPKGATLFVGSSSIRFWTTLAADFPEMKTINRGFGGSQISDVNEYMDRIVIPYAPSRIIFYAGDNDIAAGKSPSEVVKDFETFVRRVRSALPETEIYYLSIKESPSREKFSAKDREVNRLIQAFAESQPKVFYIDVDTPLYQPNGKPDPKFFRKDMLHLNPKGYAVWVGIVKKALHQNSTSP
jgi:lysophospholipase L1-like esterase